MIDLKKLTKAKTNKTCLPCVMQCKQHIEVEIKSCAIRSVPRTVHEIFVEEGKKL